MTDKMKSILRAKMKWHEALRCYYGHLTAQEADYLKSLYPKADSVKVGWTYLHIPNGKLKV